MSKYEALGRFLRSQRTAEVPMTFADVERIAGIKLPPSARKYRPWWSNNADNSVMTKVWLDAGFRAERVDMSAHKLVFRRVGKVDAKEPAPSPVPSTDRKRQHHPMLGALKGLVHIPPGVDLTEPADPEWGKIWDDES